MKLPKQWKHWARTAWWYDVAKCVAQWNLRHNADVTGLALEGDKS